MSGTHPIHRRIQDHWIWTREKFSMGQAWVDMILSATYKERKVYCGGQVITLKPGQLIWSKRSLCKRWKWSRPKLERFFGVLEADKMLIQEAIPVTTLITLCNYSKLRECAFVNDTISDTSNDTNIITSTVPVSLTKQEGKEIKEGLKINNTPPKVGEVVPVNGKCNAVRAWVNANTSKGRTATLTGKVKGVALRLNGLGVQEQDLQKWMEMYLDDNDKFVSDAGYSIVVFESRIDKYRNPVQKTYGF